MTMRVELKCRKIVREDGRIYIRWSDKAEQEFESRAHMRTYARSILGAGQSREFLRAIGVALLEEASGDGFNAAALEDRTLTIDTSTPANLMGVS